MTQKIKRGKLKTICLALLTVFFLLAPLSIIRCFIGLNASVEFERSVFISQIARQMKDNVDSTRKHNLQLTDDFAAVLSRVQPESFEEIEELFPNYSPQSSVNLLFLLSSQCELYGVDGVKHWVSLPYNEYLLDAVSLKYTTDFIRIGVDREFMVYSALLATPVIVDGHEISAVMYGWDSSEYRATLSSRLFEDKSSSLLIGKNGNIAIYPEEKDSENYGYNVFTYLSNQGMNDEDLKNIQNLVAGTGEDTILCELENGRWLFRVAEYSDSYRILIMLPIQITSAGTYKNLYGLIASVAAALLSLFLIVVAILLSVYHRQKVQHEKELQTEFLLKSVQAKNDFLAKMSHDIRTPLNGIIGMNYIASTRLPEGYPEISDYLKKVDISAKYLLGILNDILDMNKIESGHAELAAEPFSLGALIDGIEPIVLAQIEDRKIRFIVEPPSDTACKYIGDELRIKQILMNLLSNAVKFTNEGSVTLTCTATPLDDERDEIRFIICDTGKGMNEEFLSRIFSPFTQEDNSIASRYGGSGLGLSIAKSYADLMGGSISVTSELDKGSRFFVTLPLKKFAQKNISAQTSHSSGAAGKFFGKRILLCEDNDLNAEIASVILEDFGLEVDRAANGKEGVDLFCRSEPGYYSLIFMDVRMPEMDGYEATRAIRALNRTDAKSIIICALSANAFSDDIAQSKAAGMDDHLAKPVEVALLSLKLKEYLD